MTERAENAMVDELQCTLAWAETEDPRTSEPVTVADTGPSLAC
jgi:hypothetical protein